MRVSQIGLEGCPAWQKTQSEMWEGRGGVGKSKATNFLFTAMKLREKKCEKGQ